MKKIITLATIVAVTTLLSGCLGDKKTFEADIAKIVEKTLKEKPEIIIDALNAYQKSEEEKLSSKQKENVVKNKDKIQKDDHSLVIGNPNGDITITAFKDYRCGYCKRAWPVIQELLTKDKNVKVILKEFPVLGPDSELAARFALASSLQSKEKYAEFYAQLINHSGPWDRETLKEIAVKIGLDGQKIEEDAGGQFVADALSSNMALGKELNISGTPAFVIGDELVPGAIPLEAFMEIIKKQRG